MLFTVDLHEDLIDIESAAKATMLTLQTPGIFGPELDAPEPDDFGWKPLAFVGVRPEIIDFRQLR